MYYSVVYLLDDVKKLLNGSELCYLYYFMNSRAEFVRCLPAGCRLDCTTVYLSIYHTKLTMLTAAKQLDGAISTSIISADQSLFFSSPDS